MESGGRALGGPGAWGLGPSGTGTGTWDWDGPAGAPGWARAGLREQRGHTSGPRTGELAISVGCSVAAAQDELSNRRVDTGLVAVAMTMMRTVGGQQMR